jgi:hypothetical protein
VFVRANLELRNVARLHRLRIPQRQGVFERQRAIRPECQRIAIGRKALGSADSVLSDSRTVTVDFLLPFAWQNSPVAV